MLLSGYYLENGNPILLTWFACLPAKQVFPRTIITRQQTITPINENLSMRRSLIFVFSDENILFDKTGIKGD